MAQLPYEIFDGDNHYYEAEDAFTRHGAGLSPSRASV